MRGFVAALMVSGAVLGVPSMALAQEQVDDPFEPLNRRLFAVHEAIDGAVLEPLARGYRAVTPQPVRTGVRNFLRNLKGPVIFANDVLQGEGGRAGTTAVRFGLNTTIGVFGVLDPASELGFERHDEDFGQTLAVWGVDAGPYFFIPLFGPTTLRDGAGAVVDVAINPITYANYDGEGYVNGTRVVLTGLSARENVLEAVDQVRENSFDPYVTFRTTYGLWRHSAIQNGRRDIQDLPEFEAIPEYEDFEQQAPAEESVPEVTDELAPSNDTITPPSGETSEADLSFASTGVTQ